MLKSGLLPGTGTALGTLMRIDTEVGLDGLRWYASNDKAATGLDSCHRQGNHCNLIMTEVVGPELVMEARQTLLRMQPVFHLRYETGAYAAQFGVVHLVQSERSVFMEDGTQRQLLTTEEPVLYIEDPHITEPMRYLSMHQSHGTRQTYHYQLSLRQAIPDILNNKAVESVTVLEQYQSYFMQRECSNSAPQPTWTPLLLPVTWGWSIRVGRRADGDWCILLRKLIRPIEGNEGLELPRWRSNSIALSRVSGSWC